MSSDPTPTSRAVDLTLVLALTGVALTGLDTSYDSRAYLVAGLVGVGAAASWALLCVVRHWSAGVFLLVASIAFPVLGATAALHNWDWLGLPSVTAVGELLTATITAPGKLLNTIPPVDAQGTTLVIPYEIGFLLGGTSAWLALSTRRPLLPGVSLLFALALCIVLGTEQPRALALRAALFAGLLLVWVTLRASRLRPVEHGARGRSLRVAAGALVAVGAVLAASTLVPSVAASERLVLRGRVGSGYDVSQLDNPLAGFRKYTEQPAGSADNVADKRLLRVTDLPRGDLLRIVALDTYDGTVWAAGNRTVAEDRASLFQRIGEEVGAPRPGRPVSVGVEVRPPWTSSWLPLAGQLTGITFDFLDGRAQRRDVRYNVATQTGLVVGGLEAGDDYHFTATVPDPRLAGSAVAYGDGKPLQPSGAFVDQYLGPWKESGLTPMRQLFSLARYLRTNGRYSDGGAGSASRYLPGHSELRLGENFFGAPTIVGDDEQYAAFMALAANRLGVPARVVVGAFPNRRGWVRGRNVQALVEVRVADGSWRRLPASRFMSQRAPKRTDADRPSPATFVRRTTPREPTPEEPPQVQQRAPREQGTAEPSRGALLPVLLASGVVVLVGAVPLAKWLRRRRRRTSGRPSARVAGGWAEVLAAVVDGGRAVQSGLPRTEQARRLGLSVALARAADSLVFAPAEPTATQVSEFWSGVREERRRLTRDLGPVRRLVVPWSPASLVALRLPRRRRRPALRPRRT